MGAKVSSTYFEGNFQILDFRWLKEVHLKLRIALDNGQVVDAIAFNAADKYQFNDEPSSSFGYELDKMNFVAMSAYNFAFCI